jgi:hypothetical protein
MMPRDVLYFFSAENPEPIVRGRFDQMGGDPERLMILRGSIIGSGDNAIRNPYIKLSDIPLIANAIERSKAVFAIIDPIQAYLGEKVDINRSNETRPILDRLANLGADLNCSMMPNRHGRKNVASKAIYQGLGSIDQSAAARSELGAVFDNGQRAMVHISTNFGGYGDPHGFEIGKDELYGKFRWLESTNLSAASMLGTELPPEEKSRLETAVDFVKEFLNDSAAGVGDDGQMELPKGYRLQKKVVSEARSLGISERTLERAKTHLGIKAEQHDHKWYWKLPGCFWPPPAH